MEQSNCNPQKEPTTNVMDVKKGSILSQQGLEPLQPEGFGGSMGTDFQASGLNASHGKGINTDNHKGIRQIANLLEAIGLCTCNFRERAGDKVGKDGEDHPISHACNASHHKQSPDSSPQ